MKLESKKSKDSLKKYFYYLKYINDNWQEKTDQEIAKFLKIDIDIVMYLRRALGFRKRGQRCMKWTESEIKYLKVNWQKKTDQEIAQKLNRSVDAVKLKRSKFGLKRIYQTSYTWDTKIWSKAKFTKALNEDGYIPADIARELNLSRERVRQIIEKYKIKVKPSPKWYANRYKCPKLADKQYLVSLLKKNKGNVSKVQNKLHVPKHKLMIVLKHYKIKYKSFKEKKEIIKLKCTACNKTIHRDKQLLKNKNQKVFFCNRKCQGKWFGSFTSCLNPWTESEDDFLKSNWQEKTDKELAKELGRSASAVTQRRNKFKLKKGKKKKK